MAFIEVLLESGRNIAKNSLILKALWKFYIGAANGKITPYAYSLPIILS
jgi:hypothetical protein